MVGTLGEALCWDGSDGTRCRRRAGCLSKARCVSWTLFVGGCGGPARLLAARTVAEMSGRRPGQVPNRAGHEAEPFEGGDDEQLGERNTRRGQPRREGGEDEVGEEHAPDFEGRALGGGGGTAH